MDAAARAVFARPSWQASAGLGLTRLRFSGWEQGAPKGGWYLEVFPLVGGAGHLAAGPGALGLELTLGGKPSLWAANGQLAFELGDHLWRPRLAVEGRATGGRNEVSVDDSSLLIEQQDWSVAVLMGLAWGRPW